MEQCLHYCHEKEQNNLGMNISPIINHSSRVTESVQSTFIERILSIAKDLINSKDPKHTLFCHETAFVVIYVFF